MKKVWNSFRLAFAVYSIFPVPQVRRTRENMKYILIFVPLIGAGIGFLIREWMVVSPYLVNRDLLGAVICVMLPIFLSGGAFLDGFLRDSHSGYFAIIVCVSYFFLSVGLWSEMPLASWQVLAYGFVLSRALYGLSIVLFPHTQKSKCSLYVGKDQSRWIVAGFMVIYIGICLMGMMMTDPMVAVQCVIGAVLAFLYYCYVAFHHFGGITEDIAGFFVHVCEIMMPLVVLVTNIITSLDISSIKM